MLEIADKSPVREPDDTAADKRPGEPSVGARTRAGGIRRGDSGIEL
jgi:hypothetical protein